MDKLNLIDFDKYTITEDGKIFSKYWNRFIQYDLKTNEPIKEWQSSKDVEKQLGFDRGAIRRVCRGLHKQAYGYGWKDLCP